MLRAEEIIDGVSSLAGKRCLHTFRSRRDAVGTRRVCEWRELVEMLRTPHVTAERAEEFVAMTKDQQAKLKDVGGYIAGHVDGKRASGGVRSRWLVTLDIDEAAIDDADRIASALHGVAHAIHSTRRSSDDAPRLRLLIPLAQSLPPREYVEVSRYCESLLASAGVHGVDPGSHEPARMMFFPSISHDQKYFFSASDGIELDGSAVVMRSDAKKTFYDPRKKAGYEGAFCRAYNVIDAIDRYCSDVYIRRGEMRYEYAGSESGSAGVHVFSDLLASYSHHDSDPLRGRAASAYDIVLQHRYGGDRDRMHADIRSDDAVVRQLDAVAVDATDGDSADWRIALARDESGKLVKSINNILTILLHDESVCNSIMFNELNECPEITGPLPWRASAVPARWGDDDYLCLLGWLEGTWHIYSRDRTEAALAALYKVRRYDPLVSYLDRAASAWDGVPRAERVLADYLGADATPYVLACTRMMMLGAVARAYDPGCKYDYVVCLLSRQGAGKSTLLSRLGGEWYTDSITTMEGIEAYESLRGAWIVEIAELAAKRRSGRDAVKKFLTSKVDVYRPKYGRNTRQFLRRNIFVATTNDHDMLSDPTGNRRFLPIDCAGSASMDVHAMTADDVLQIWGEVVHWYRGGARPVLAASDERAAETVRSAHTDLGMMTEAVLAYLDRPISAEWYRLSLHDRRALLHRPDGMCTRKRDFVSTREIWREVCDGQTDAAPYDVRAQITTAMAYLRSQGWTRGVRRLGRDYGERSVTGLCRPVSAQKSAE